MAASCLFADGRSSARFERPRFPAQPFNGAEHQPNFPVGPVASTCVISCLGAPLVGWIS
jgi:hypothetical protein